MRLVDYWLAFFFSNSFFNKMAGVGKISPNCEAFLVAMEMNGLKVTQRSF